MVKGLRSVLPNTPTSCFCLQKTQMHHIMQNELRVSVRQSSVFPRLRFPHEVVAEADCPSLQMRYADIKCSQLYIHKNRLHNQ